MTVPRPPHRSPSTAPAERRALSHVGGEVTVEGVDEASAAALRDALNVDPEESVVMRHVHGFHSYPARLHPDTAAALIAHWSAPRDIVLDPFCGSGTVLVEARLAGRRGLGNDANPFATELAWLKTQGASPAQRAQLVSVADRVRAFADERREARSGPSRRYGEEDRAEFDVHVLLELDSLWLGLESLPDGYAKRALRLVLSATLGKVSRRAGDTAQRAVPKRIAAGFAARYFVARAEELAERLSLFTAQLARGAAVPQLRVGDARRLGSLPEPIDLVVSSPPYPGVYDYLAHHATRLRWLGLPAGKFERQELGARRHYAALDAERAQARWADDFRAVHRQLSAVVRPGGHVMWIMADSVVGRSVFRPARQTPPLAEAEGFRFVGAASQQRPHFHRPTAWAFANEPRREHVLVFERTDQPPRRKPRKRPRASS